MAPTKSTRPTVSESHRCSPTSSSAEHLQCLLAIAQVINSSLELDLVLERLLTQATAVLYADSGSVMLVDEATNRLTVLAACGPRAEEIYGRSQRVGQGVAGWVALNGAPLLLHGRPDKDRYESVCERQDVSDALCVPITVDGRVLGIISLNNCRHERSFNTEDLALLEAIASQAALAIRNAQTFEELRRQQQAVERLLNEVVHAQDEERKRIALQIHDGPAQTLHALLRGLEAVEAGNENGSDGKSPELAALERTVREAINEIRHLIVDLRPLSMDELGLLAGLNRYGQLFEQRTGIPTQVCHRGYDLKVPEAVASAFYRIAQEGLANVWKHAEARHARILLEIDDHHVALEVGDDGKGFDTEQLRGAPPQQIGLASVRDRVEMMGGRLAIASVPGEGTVLRVAVPQEKPSPARRSLVSGGRVSR